MRYLDQISDMRAPQPGRSADGESVGWLHWSHRRVATVAALWIIAAILFIALSVTIHAHPKTEFPGDVGLIVLVQQIHQPIIKAFINFASDANWPTPAGAIVIVTTVLLLLFRRWRAAICVVIAGFVSDGVSFAINGWVQRPRPHNVQIHAVANIGIGSFPSGHVSHATAFYGLLLFLSIQEMRKHPRWTPALRAIQVICVYFLLFIGVSRLLEGEHWPTDVFASYLLGGMMVVAAIVIYEWLGLLGARRRERVQQAQHPERAPNAPSASLPGSV